MLIRKKLHNQIVVVFGIVVLSLFILPITSYASPVLIGKAWAEEQFVAPDKQWKILFNLTLNTASVESGGIYVIDKAGNHYPICFGYQDNKKQVCVIPQSNYVAGQTYYLQVSSSVTSEGNAPLLRPVWLKFTINSLTDAVVTKENNYNIITSNISLIPANNLITAKQTPITTAVTVDTFFRNIIFPANSSYKVANASTITGAFENWDFDTITGKAANARLAENDLLLIKAADGTLRGYQISVNLSSESASVVISLPFLENNTPFNLMPMGETINHPDPPNKGGHPGIDFMWNESADIIACIDGTVARVEKTVSHNKWDVYIDTNDFYIGYTTLEDVDDYIEVGAQVRAGQKIGAPGNFGTHYMIHWELGKIVGGNRICPMAYFDEISRQRIVEIWRNTNWPDMKEQFPHICNNIYRCDYCIENGY